MLAAVLIYLGWRDKKEAREDMKEARTLFSRMIDMAASAASAQTALKDAVDGLRGEIAGLRAGVHDRVIPAISGIQSELMSIDRRLTKAEKRIGAGESAARDLARESGNG